MKPRIATFFTGGTISMRIDPKSGGAVPALSGREILDEVPRLNEIADFDVVDFARLPGPHWTPAKMMELARAVRAKLVAEDVVGAVITHGTDTLEETAYFLDLVLAEHKPVAVVGAMRTISDLSWDGPANLDAAVRVAIDPQARDLGVLVVMNGQMIAASEAVKMHTEHIDTLQSRDYGPLGFVEADRVLVTRRPIFRRHIATDRIEEHVDLIKLYAGADGRFIDFAVNTGARGLVIQALGVGNVPVAAVPAIERALATGIPVVITSRSARGRVLDAYAYEGGGKQLTQKGAILGAMLPAQKARIKLMLALGAGWNTERIRESFAT